jgi:preprotein translocase SecE subunit
MAGIGQYLKDTQTELRHVAWPTQTQTIVYTILVAAISVGVALYLGLFDFIFTSALKRVVVPSQANPIQVTQQAATGSSPTLDLPGDSSTQ